MPQISVLYPEQDRCEMEISKGGLLIGRDHFCDIKLSDEFVSAKHCRIFYEDECFFIEDQGSTNGTFINGNEISAHKAIQLAPGHSIQIGVSVLKVK